MDTKNIRSRSGSLISRLAALPLLASCFAVALPAAATSTNFQSTEGPAFAVWGTSGQLLMAWTDYSSNPHAIKYATSTDGSSWSSASTLFNNNTSISGAAPSIAYFNGKMYLAWTGGGNDINICSASTVGGAFSSQSIIKNSSGHAQTALGSTVMTVYNGRLYIGWTGTDGTHTFNVASSSDGVNFTNSTQYLVDGLYGSTYSPALSTDGTYLYFATSAGPTSGAVALSILKISADTSGNQTLLSTTATGYDSNTGPGLGYVNGTLAIGYTQTSSTEFNVEAFSTSGGSLSPSTIWNFTGTMEGSPGLVGFNGHMYLGYTNTYTQVNVINVEEVF